METSTNVLSTLQSGTKSEHKCKDAPEEIECPPSPLPDGDVIKLPEMPKDYYSKVPAEQIQQIDGIRTKEKNTAAEKKEDEIAAATEAYNTAQDVFSKAIREKDSAIKSLDIKSKNKKTEYWRVYNECLIKSLPKGCPGTGTEQTTLEQRVPPDKLAICMAELKKSIADEDLDYYKKLKEIEVKFADAECLLKKAEVIYKSAICEAKLTKEQADKQAEVTWHTSLSRLVEQYK